jgi:hypothetical protein
MTGLHQTELTLSQKVQCAAQALGRQAHGAITALSAEFGLSRPTVYRAAATAQAVLERHFDPANDESVSVVIDQRQLRRAVVALRVVGMNSIRAIEELLPLLYPGYRCSYGTVQSWLVEADGRARQWNAQVPLSAIRYWRVWIWTAGMCSVWRYVTAEAVKTGRRCCARPSARVSI